MACIVGVAMLALTHAIPLTAGEKKGRPEPPPPGTEHLRLKELAGTFDARVTIFLAPDKTMQATGVMKRQIVLGGRFLQEEYDGTFADKPFKGLGLTGYDSTKKKYVSMWADSMTSSIMASEGTYDEKTGPLSTKARTPIPTPARR